MSAEHGEARKRVKKINKGISKIKISSSPQEKLRLKKESEVREIAKEKEDEKRTEFVKKEILPFLQELNREILGGHGKVVPWSKETSTHVDHGVSWGQDWEKIPESEDHTIEADIVRLIVPNIGTMVVFVTVSKHFYLSTFLHHEEELFCDEKEKNVLYLADYKIDDPSEKKFLSHFKEMLSNSLVALHEKVLLDEEMQEAS